MPYSNASVPCSKLLLTFVLITYTLNPWLDLVAVRTQLVNSQLPQSVCMFEFTLTTLAVNSSLRSIIDNAFSFWILVLREGYSHETFGVSPCFPKRHVSFKSLSILNGLSDIFTDIFTTYSRTNSRHIHGHIHRNSDCSIKLKDIHYLPLCMGKLWSLNLREEGRNKWLGPPSQHKPIDCVVY